jgi:YidC/Oxa1 family membrane protein insertase
MLISANIFQPLIDVFQSVLVFFHNSLGLQWGWAIVLLTVCVRAVLLPLTVKQFHSMQKMQRLAPQMKELQAKYKDDKERQQQEMMRFYRENGVNPLGSCLPLVAQLPVFISLYYMLRTSLRIDICPAIQRAHNHGVLSTAHTVPCGVHGPFAPASFLFIPDLTNKASGAVLVVLIVLYVGTQLGSSLMMTSSTMDPTQRKLMLAMPLLFVLFVINFPAGVMVYWITTNAWTMGQQYIIKRRIGPTAAAPATAGATATSVVATSGKSPPSKEDGAGDSSANGSGSGGLGALLRGRPKGDDDKQKAAVGTTTRSGPPPKPPRKKKKRSGRRR